MTRTEFVQLASDQVHGENCELNEFEIAAILAAIGTAVSYLVTECLDKLTHKDVTRPNRMQKWALRRIAVKAVDRTATEHPSGGRALWYGVKSAWREDDEDVRRRMCEAEYEVYDALLCAGRALTPQQFESLKTNLKGEATTQ